MFRRIRDRTFRACAALAFVCVASVASFGVGVAADRSDAAEAAARQANYAEVIEAVRGDATPEDGQLRRLAGDLAEWMASHDGSLDGYTADPATFHGLAGVLGVSPFQSGMICDDCGRLTPEFARRVEQGDSVFPVVAQPGWGSVWAGAGAASVVYLAGSAGVVYVLLRREARRRGRRWNTVRWDRNDPDVRMIRAVAPLTGPLSRWTFTWARTRYREAVAALGYSEQLADAQRSLDDLAGDDSPEARAQVARIRELLGKVDVEVARFDDSLTGLDPVGRRRRIDEQVAALAERVEAREQAWAVVDAVDVSMPDRRALPQGRVAGGGR